MEISSFNLSWQGFNDCFTTAFKSLNGDDPFSDITLICKQKKKLKAHKVIISACSSFFKKILLDLPSGHLNLYLDSISFDDLKNVISFMYSGRTIVEKEKLDDFLLVCRKLEIEGLPGDTVKDDDKDVDMTLNDSIPLQSSEDEIGDFEYKAEENASDNQPPHALTEPKVENQITTAEVPEFRFRTEFIKGERKFICELCQYCSTYKNHLKLHFEDKHLHIRYPCNLCEYTSGSPSDLSKHKKFKHEQLRKHHCQKCDYKAFDLGGLKNHLARKHNLNDEDLTNLKDPKSESDNNVQDQ